MRINQNVMAFNAYRNLNQTQGQMGQTLEKLSSGFRINRAADDAAGLSISEQLRSETRGLSQASRNSQDGISLVQTAEGALSEVHEMLQRMRELAVQANNTGTNDDDALAAIQEEINELQAEIDRVGQDTSFAGVNLFDGQFAESAAEAGEATFENLDDTNLDFDTGDDFVFEISVDGDAAQTVTLDSDHSGDEAALLTDLNNQTTGATWSVEDGDLVVTSDTTGEDSQVGIEVQSGDALGTNIANVEESGVAAGAGAIFQVGAYDGNTLEVTIDEVGAESLGIDAIDVTDADSLDGAIGVIDEAIGEVSTLRSTLGATQNRLEHTIANLEVTTENLRASESRIRDADMAMEMVNFTRDQILQQAGTAMLGQANQLPQSVLGLLQ